MKKCENLITNDLDKIEIDTISMPFIFRMTLHVIFIGLYTISEETMIKSKKQKSIATLICTFFSNAARISHIRNNNVIKMIKKPEKMTIPKYG